MSRSYYDDNYGHYDIQDEDDVEFYRSVQRRSVLKKCVGCRKKKLLLPEYAYCDSCATKIENGMDVG